MGLSQPPFSLLFALFTIIHISKIVDSRRIQTQIIRVEGLPDDHLTTTTIAPVYYYCGLNQSQLNTILLITTCPRNCTYRLPKNTPRRFAQSKFEPRAMRMRVMIQGSVFVINQLTVRIAVIAAVSLHSCQNVKQFTIVNYDSTLIIYIFFSKMGHPGLFFCLFSSFQANNTIVIQINAKKYSSSIRCWYLNLLDHNSPPVTTRPGLPPMQFFKLARLYSQKLRSQRLYRIDHRSQSMLSGCLIFLL